jgi:hypothetical protein
MPNTNSLHIAYLININPESGMVWRLTMSQGASIDLDPFSGDYTISSTEQLFLTKTLALSVDDEIFSPKLFTLHQNYPNPFNPITTLRYDLPVESFVTLNIYDMLGREITQLVNTTQNAGFKSVLWDAKASMGKPVSAGVYLYRLQTGEYTETKKLLLLK